MWSFVAKKQKDCDPDDPADDHKGDWWDFVAYDAEHRLVLAVVPGARSIGNAEEVVREVHDRTGGQTDVLSTGDELAAYETAIDHVYGVPVEPERPAVVPGREVPADLKYATAPKEREKGRVVAITAAVVLGTWRRWPARWSDRSRAGRSTPRSWSGITSPTGTTTRGVAEDLPIQQGLAEHEAMTYFTKYSYNFCWPVRTLREPTDSGAWRKRTPAMTRRPERSRMAAQGMADPPGHSVILGHDRNLRP